MADDNFIISAPLELLEFVTTPPAPPAGTLEVYGKTDDKIYKQTSAGVETEIGGGSSAADAETFAVFMSG